VNTHDRGKDAVDILKATTADTAAPLGVARGVSEPDAVILGRRRRGNRHDFLRRMLGSADVAAAVVGAIVLGLVSGASMSQGSLLIAGLVIAWPASAFMCGLYAAEDLRTWASGITETPKLALAVLLVSWLSFGAIELLDLKHPAVSALVAATAIGLSASLLRACVRAWAHRATQLREQTLIVGSGDVARRVTHRLRAHDEVGLDVVGYVDNEVNEVGSVGLRRVGVLDDLERILASGAVDRVIIAFSRAGHEELLQCIRVCRDAGVTVDIVPRLFDFLHGARVLDQVGDMPLLSIGPAGLARSSRAAKRVLDVIGAALALIVLAPVLVAVAAAIKIDSRGPVLFAQRRPGRGGELFRLLKFRSMVRDAEVEVEARGQLVKIAADERITRVGRFIRRFSLDEAPQLLNVVRGDMSLVGPRPIVAAEIDALTEPWQGRRLDLRPGLTGPWQILGRSHIPLEERVMLDYQYVAGWSLARDLEILLATVPAVLSGRGAY
jgi:exopolysaccharide biosynthesis polyprenyl glycosylphosphotransferase